MDLIDGEKVKELRLAKSWSQEGLASEALKYYKRKQKKAKMAISTISNIETGKTKDCKKITRWALAKALDVDPDELLLKIQRYEKYVNKVLSLYPEEFVHLRRWVDLYGIEINPLGLPDKEKRRPVNLVKKLKESVESDKNALIFGVPGAGKTLTCLKLFEEFRKEDLNSKSTLKERISLFVAFSQIKKQIKNSTFEIIIRGIINEAKLRQNKANYLIFLDGLNVIGNLEKQQEVFGEIASFAISNTDIQIIVTTSTFDNSFKKFGNFLVYETQPWERNDVIKYWIKYEDKFKTQKEAETFFDYFSDYIKNFISTPMFSKILVTTYEKGEGLPISNPGKLFQGYEEFLCGPREFRAGMDEDIRGSVIPFLAFNMCQKNEPSITLKNLNKYVHKYKTEFGSSLNERKVRETLTYTFRLMRKDENGDFEFIHMTLRDYFAAVYMRNENLSTEKILNLVYPNSYKNENIINAVKFLVGIVKAKNSKAIIQKSLEKDLYLACELFAWSSIDTYDHEIVESINNKIKFESWEYMSKLESAIRFYLKVSDLLQKANKHDEPISAFFRRSIGMAYHWQRDFEMVIKYCTEAISIYENCNMGKDPDIALCYLFIGFAHADELDYERAIKYYKKAISIYEKHKKKQYAHFYNLCETSLGLAYGHLNGLDVGYKFVDSFSIFITEIETNESNSSNSNFS